MNWYKWTSLNAFNLWHENLKTKLGLPKESVNLSGDLIDSGITTDAYTLHFVISKSDIRAMVEIEHAEGLTESENPFPSRYE